MSAMQVTTHSALTSDATLVAAGDWEELASREADGIEVRLLWSKSADRVQVTVTDSKFDEEFVLAVAGADALAAFNHPFAYAPSRSSRIDEAGRETLDLHSQD
jgi:hypothetical protein